MNAQSSPSAPLVLLLVLVAGCSISGCQYQPEMDALSAFPANPDGKSISEIDLIPLRSTNEPDRSDPPVAIVNMTTPKDAWSEIESNVRARPYAVARQDVVAVGCWTRFDSDWTGLDSVASREFGPQDGDKLQTPFCLAGIAVGDFDRDGLPDIFLCDQHQGGRLFRNLGDFKFEDVTEAMGIQVGAMWGTSAAIVDINGDGLLDIYLCGYDTPNRLFINQGRKFDEQAAKYGLDFQGACVAASFADYDRDGDLDLYLVTHRLAPKNPVTQLPIERPPGESPKVSEEYLEQYHLIEYRDGSYIPVESGQFDRLYRNDGYRFVDVTESSMIGKHPYHGMAAVWCDLNADQWPDLIVSNDHKDPVMLYINNGPNEQNEVTFSIQTAERLTQQCWFSKGIDIGDLDQDGKVDLLVAGSTAGNHIQRVTGSGHLHGKAGDEWFLNWSQPSQTLGNALFLNHGVGTFQNMAQTLGMAYTGWTWAIRICDFDNDGFPDLFFATGQIRPFLDDDLNRQIRVAMQQDKTFSRKEFWLEQESIPSPNRVFRGLGELRFEDVGATWGLEDEDQAQIVALADLDDDGDLDVITWGYRQPLRIHRNDINNHNSIQVLLKGIQSNSKGLGAEVRAKFGGREAIQYGTNSRGFMTSEDASFSFGLGAATVVDELKIQWPLGAIQTIRNLAANHVYEIQEPSAANLVSRGIRMETSGSLFAKQSSVFSSIKLDELEFDDFLRQPLLPFKHSTLGPGLAWGDIDGDGDYDLFVGGSMFQPGQLCENQGKMKFRIGTQECFQVDRRCEDQGAVFFDFDQDGDLDLYVVSGGVESGLEAVEMQDRLYLNQGAGEFVLAKGVLPEMPISGSCVAVADFDNDGRPDIFVGGRIVPDEYPVSPRSVLLRYNGTVFEDVIDHLAPDLARCGMVTSCVWSDVDGDGWFDLLVTTEYGPVRLFRNQQGRLVEHTEQAGLGQWHGFFTSITAGDVDNDGDTDFVVGNLGTNTVYSAHPSGFVELFRGAFGESDAIQLLEAIQIDGRLLPFHSLDALKMHINIPAAFSQSSKVFSQTEISKLVGADRLKQSASLTVNSLESGVLINETVNGTIRFSFVPLPPRVQAAPVFGCQLCDVDGDGFLDLYLVQNQFDSNPLIERCVNGRSELLLGDGRGGFYRPEKLSGLEIFANARALTSCDLNDDGKVDFVASTTNAGLFAFTSRSRSVHFAIDVREISEGRNYLGAKVWLNFKNGTRQLHEIRSNSGYLSQSPPIVFAGFEPRNEIESVTVTWPDGTTKSSPLKQMLGR